MNKYVLDSSAFINRIYELLPLDAELWTTSDVYLEVKSKMRFLLFNRDLKVHDPSPETVKEVLKAAAYTGDLHYLSSADIRIIAAAKELNATLVTDDLAMQNVAAYLNVPFMGIKRITHIIIWRRLCEDGRVVNSPDECAGYAKRIVRRKRKLRRIFID